MEYETLSKKLAFGLPWTSSLGFCFVEERCKDNRNYHQVQCFTTSTSYISHCIKSKYITKTSFKTISELHFTLPIILKSKWCSPTWTVIKTNTSSYSMYLKKHISGFQKSSENWNNRFCNSKGLHCTIVILLMNSSYTWDLDATMKIMKRIKISTRKAASYSLPSVVQWFLVYVALTANISWSL